MTPADRHEITQACRELAFSMVPSNAPTPPVIFDADAEQLVLAAAAEGIRPSKPVSPSDFFIKLNGGVAEVLDACRVAGVQPTVRKVLIGLRALGFDGPQLELFVERTLDATAIAVRIDEIAHRVRALAWRRRLAMQCDRLRAVVVEPTASIEQVEAEIDQLAELVGTQPRSEGA